MRALAAALLLLATAWGAPDRSGAQEADVASRLMAAEGKALERLQAELSSVARERFRLLSETGSWSDSQVDELLDLVLVDARRAYSDPSFLERAVVVAAGSLPDRPSAELQGELLERMSRPPGLELWAFEEVETAWGSAQRRSLDRRLQSGRRTGASSSDPPPGSPWPAFGPEPDGRPIALSIYSLPSGLFSRPDVEGFLRSLRRSAPARPIAVLADLPQQRSLEPLAEELELDLIRTWGRSYSPWPRDPMSFLVSSGGERLAVLRPNRQPTRADDSFMGLELIRDLPAALWERLGPISWAVAPIPFHNGNVVPAADANWISIHALEPRALELLGRQRVPVETFGSVAGVQEYLSATRRAAAEMAAVFGRRVRFVHPLPEGDDPVALGAAMGRLGGGAGFDLDSLVTLLADAPGGPAAIVADPGAGRELVATAAAAELRRLAGSYGITGEGEGLRGALVTAQSAPTVERLGGFLELVAGHLGAEGFRVRRLPLLWVPTPLLERAEDYPDAGFLVGWQNVVLEVTESGRRAEGFASLLESGDRAARATFAELGYELVLLPPLIESVLRNGGYRCASNHLRELAALPEPHSPVGDR